MVPLELSRLTVVLGHWKLPPKLTQSSARWRTRQFPHNLVDVWIVLRLWRNLRLAAPEEVCIHSLQEIHLHSCMYVLRAIPLHRCIHVIHSNTNHRETPPHFQPIGDRTTFRIKLRPNIQTPSIKGVVKIRVIIINLIKRQMAHKFLTAPLIHMGSCKESLAWQQVASTPGCLAKTPSWTHRRQYLRPRGQHQAP